MSAIQRARAAIRADPWSAAAAAALLALLASATATLLAPLFADLSAYGTHDWDSQAVYRASAVVSLARYHELPFWDPWLCGGFPSWAYAEGATDLVSPWLPAYLALPVQVALRVEVLGSALVGLSGTWLFASRFTRSQALRGLVVLLFALNGRWTLQMAMGHAWHLQYAWMPLALYSFDRAICEGKARFALATGAVLALIGYLGGVYPLPHTALALCLYALAHAVQRRSLRPLALVALAGATAFGLFAPKLLPMFDLISRFPRTIESAEVTGLRQLVSMLTDRSLVAGKVPGFDWGWHEFGIYLGVPGTVLLALALVGAFGSRALPLRLLGLVFLALGFGAFAWWSPWALLHRVPPFTSQHVPSRFLYPAVLFIAAAFAAAAGPLVERLTQRRPWLDLALVALLVPVAFDLASWGRQATSHAFYLKAPPVVRSEEFVQHREPPGRYTPPHAWAGASLLSLQANTGYLGCDSVPDRAEPHGALASESASYRGEAYVVEGEGRARIVSWSPSSAEIEVTGATPGALLVLNTNYDPSWLVDGAPALDHAHAVAARIADVEQRIRFDYRPRTLGWGLTLFALTVLAWIAAPRLLSQRRRR
jgi:hypothetical protein